MKSKFLRLFFGLIILFGFIIFQGSEDHHHDGCSCSEDDYFFATLIFKNNTFEDLQVFYRPKKDVVIPKTVKAYSSAYLYVYREEVLVLIYGLSRYKDVYLYGVMIPIKNNETKIFNYNGSKSSM